MCVSVCRNIYTYTYMNLFVYLYMYTDICGMCPVLLLLFLLQRPEYANIMYLYIHTFHVYMYTSYMRYMMLKP